MKNLIVFILFGLISFQVSASNIKDFSTDGCSSYPDGIPLLETNKWFHCCFTHVISYWVGGSKAEKDHADGELNRCVSEESFPLHGKVMQIGVAAGGVPDTFFPWRWGYGFSEDRTYNKMSLEEKERVFQKYDGILDTIENLEEVLSHKQRGYMLARYELLRHNLAEEISLPREKEVENFEERVEQVKRIIARPLEGL